MLSRFTAGASTAGLDDVAAAGGPAPWFEQQLTPAAIPDEQADALWSWFPSLALTPSQKWDAYQAGTMTGAQVTTDLASWVMLRRLLSRRAVAEMMVDFWSNLLHVASPCPTVWLWRVEYQSLIRKLALGRFDQLLMGVIEHPAMGLYLNNVESTARAMNENLGRELLECHTVGVGVFTERDVTNSTRMLTGFHVDQGRTWEATYVPADHWVGRVSVLGFKSANSQADGRPALKKYLSYLAHHPATAQRICRRLAVRFVSDVPSQALVDSLAQVYLDSGTDIRPVLRALVASDEFKLSALQKVRTPVEDAIATWNALRVVVARPQSELDAGNQLPTTSRLMGQIVYDWPTPDAFPDLAADWTGSGRLLGSMRVHWNSSTGSIPIQGIVFKSPAYWMPQLPTTFDHVVVNVVRKSLFLECSPTILQAACAAMDCKPTDIVDEYHPVLGPGFARLMVSILDSTEHLRR